MNYVVEPGDTVSGIAKHFTGDASKWPALCTANPQLQRHPSYGCYLQVGKPVELPAAWVTTPDPNAPPGPGPGPAAPADVLAPPAPTTKINSTVVLVGAAAIAGLVVVVYAIKKRSRTPNRRRRR